MKGPEKRVDKQTDKVYIFQKFSYMPPAARLMALTPGIRSSAGAET
jgi:hypothetical protein